MYVIATCMLDNFSSFCCLLTFSQINVLKKSTRNTIRRLNRMDHYQNLCQTLIWVQTVCKLVNSRRQKLQSYFFLFLAEMLLLYTYSISFNDKYVYQVTQGTKIFKYCTCPAGRVTYNFQSSCKRMHMSLKSVCNKEHKWVICNTTSSSNSSFGKNCVSFLHVDFTRNCEGTSGIFVPCPSF